MRVRGNGPADKCAIQLSHGEDSPPKEPFGPDG